MCVGRALQAEGGACRAAAGGTGEGEGVEEAVPERLSGSWGPVLLGFLSQVNGGVVLF